MSVMVPNSDAVLPVVCYSSTHQRPQDRYAAWREGSLLSFGQRYDTEPLAPFAVETTAASLGAIGFSQSRMTAQHWSRTSAHIRADDVDQLMVAVRFTGIGQGDFAGRDFVAPPGSVVLSDFAQPQTYCSDDAHTAVIAIPRDLAERTLPRVRTLHGLVIAPDAATLLRSHAGAMIAALDAGLPAVHAERLGQVMLDLLGIAVAQARPSALPIPAVATGARLAAEAAIERRLGSPLSIDDLCRWTGVSRATLYRLFEPDGGVQAYITARRLAEIEQELRLGAAQSLADLADRWGFRDVSHFSRLFRARYGQSPAVFREAHRRIDGGWDSD